MKLFVTNKPNQKEISLLILCVLIGFALRFYTLDQKSLWIDEIHTLNDSRDGILRTNLNITKKTQPTFTLLYFSCSPIYSIHFQNQSETCVSFL